MTYNEESPVKKVRLEVDWKKIIAGMYHAYIRALKDKHPVFLLIPKN